MEKEKSSLVTGKLTVERYTHLQVNLDLITSAFFLELPVSMIATLAFATLGTH